MSIYFDVYQFDFKNVQCTVYEISLFVKEVSLKLKYLFLILPYLKTDRVENYLNMKHF